MSKTPVPANAVKEEIKHVTDHDDPPYKPAVWDTHGKSWSSLKPDNDDLKKLDTKILAGRKHDKGKARMDLLSPIAIEATAQVLTYGAEKYDARNWESGLDYGRVYAALQRHLNAWWSGQDKDPESDLSHLDHAACCVHFLQHYVHQEEIYEDFDDRPFSERNWT